MGSVAEAWQEAGTHTLPPLHGHLAVTPRTLPGGICSWYPCTLGWGLKLLASPFTEKMVSLVAPFPLGSELWLADPCQWQEDRGLE